jgi:hypothetical protein
MIWVPTGPILSCRPEANPKMADTITNVIPVTPEIPVMVCKARHPGEGVRVPGQLLFLRHPWVPALRGNDNGVCFSWKKAARALPSKD